MIKTRSLQNLEKAALRTSTTFGKFYKSARWRGTRRAQWITYNTGTVYLYPAPSGPPKHGRVYGTCSPGTYYREHIALITQNTCKFVVVSEVSQECEKHLPALFFYS